MTSKLGPLPVWAWVGIAAAGGVVVLLWLQNRKAGAASTTNNTTNVPDTQVTDLQSQLATVESQIRDLQGASSTTTPPPDGTGTPAPTQHATENVKAGWHVDQWVHDLNTSGEAPGITWDKLVALNPTIVANVAWGHANTAQNTFLHDATYRLQ